MDILPQIKSSFFFSGVTDFNFDDVTAKMDIIPTETRKKEDFPIKELANPFWALDTEKESCKAVSIQLEKLIKLLIGKELLIKEICNKYDIQAGFLINIWMENGDKPEMLLTKEIISFISSIDAEIGFDLYVD